MTDKELRSLKRIDLLKILIEQEKELEAIRGKAEKAQQKLENREIQLEQAGNIAEAALQLNGIFETAQEAAQQYLDNIKRMSECQEKKCYEKEKNVQEQCAFIEEETRKKCAAMEEETKKQCAFMEEETRKKCAAMEEETKKKTEERWLELSEKLEAFYDAHKGLRKLVTVTGEIESE